MVKVSRENILQSIRELISDETGRRSVAGEAARLEIQSERIYKEMTTKERSLLTRNRQSEEHTVSCSCLCGHSGNFHSM